MNDGWVNEVFVSIQGEGPYTGVRQAFIRLCGCSFGCKYCDTKRARARRKSADINGKKLNNPVSAARVVRAVRRLGPVHSVSITGGEPLEQPEFASALLKALKNAGYKTYLETNAAHPAALKKLLKYTDVVSADVKLQSATGRKAVWKEHFASLKASGSKAFVKIVVTGETSAAELEKALKMLLKIRADLTVVIQPDSALGIKGALSKFSGVIAKGILKDLRILPQFHKIAGLR